MLPSPGSRPQGYFESIAYTYNSLLVNDTLDEKPNVCTNSALMVTPHHGTWIIVLCLMLYTIDGDTTSKFAKMAAEVIAQLSNAIKMTQELRLSVTRVTEQLSNGTKKPSHEDTGSQTKEKRFLYDLQKSLLAVNTYMRYIIAHK